MSMRKRFIPTMALLVALVATAALTSATAASKPRYSQGITNKTITIGTTLPLTGGAAVAGQAFQIGLQKAVSEVNSHGGINGRKVKLVVLDDGFTAARSVANILRLGDQDKVFAVVGAAGTSNIPGSYPYIKRKGLILFGSVNPPDPNLPNVFMLATPLQAQQRILVDYAKSKGAKTIGFIGADNTEGAIRWAGVQQQAKIDGLKIVDRETVEAHSTDISSQVLALRQHNPDAILLGGDNNVSSLLLLQLQQLGWHPLVLGDSSNAGAGGSNVTKPAGAAANGLVGTTPLALPTQDSPGVNHWRSLGDPAPAANFDIQDYATAQVFFEILRRCGNNLTWGHFIKTAIQMKNYKTGILPPVTFSPYSKKQIGSRVQSSAEIAVYNNGSWSVVTGFLTPKS